MNRDHRDPQEFDLTKPRVASCKQNWKWHQVDIQFAQRKGLEINQTRCNAIIFHETLPGYCVPKAIILKSAEIVFQKVFMSLRPPPKISCSDYWINELDSEVGGRSKYTQRIQSKPKTQLSRTGRPTKGTSMHRESRRWIRIHTKLRVDLQK